MKYALPRPPSITRRTGYIAPRVEIVIACEGKNTEPQYLRDCIDGYAAGLVKLRILPRNGIPTTVVRVAIEERERLLSERRKSGDRLDSIFRVWAVFDRDEHPEVPEALHLAQQNKIDVAFSNPCFEIWPLLHLVDYGAQDGRHAVQSRLSAVMPGYDHAKGATVDFLAIRDLFPTAYDRAERLVEQRAQEGVPLGCPSTTVGELVKKITQNGKGAFARQRRSMP